MLYEVIVENLLGVDGTVTSTSGNQFTVSSPLNDKPGSNPEELLGASWATCLNATIQSLLLARGYQDVASRVRVRITLEKDNPGFYFTLKALVAIDLSDQKIIKQLTQSAHKRCPVSKIIGQYEHISVENEPF